MQREGGGGLRVAGLLGRVIAACRLHGRGNVSRGPALTVAKPLLGLRCQAKLCVRWYSETMPPGSGLLQRFIATARYQVFQSHRARTAKLQAYTALLSVGHVLGMQRLLNVSGIPLRAGSYYNGDNQPYTGPGAYYDYSSTGGIPAQTTGFAAVIPAVEG